MEKAKEKISYHDTVMGTGSKSYACMEDFMEVAKDDLIEEGDDESCFGIEMTREEKMETRRPWRNSVIIKLVGRSIKYHYLWRRIRVMWRTQVEPLLIDLANDFFIVKLGRREEFIRALSERPWMIRDNYLHVQRWKPNFTAEEAVITSMSA